LQVEGLSPLIQFVPGMTQTLFQIGFFGFYLFGDENTQLLSVVALSYLPAYFIYVRWSSKFTLYWQLPSQKALIDQYTVLIEILTNIPTIKAFNGYKAASLSFLAQVDQTFCHIAFNALILSFRSIALLGLRYTPVS
jgi:hypothetical protein